MACWQMPPKPSIDKTTTTAYDLAGNVTSVTDPLSHTYSWEYDALNRATVTRFR